MKKYLVIVLTMIILSTNLVTVNANPANINAEAYILIDSVTGQVICEYNSDKKLYPASTTKIMTAVLALEKGKLDQWMTASESAVNDIGLGGMNIGIMADEQLRMEDLLNALLVRSANETANIIAENICSTRSEFMDLMNKRAVELGATNTHFVNPCGKDNSKSEVNHLTTAKDLAMIARHAMTFPKFREIVQKKTCTIPPTNKHSKEVILGTTNKLLTNGKYKSEYYSQVTGVKTGYTDRAGNNLVSAARNSDGMELIAVVMGVKNQISQSVFAHSKKLLEYGFKNYALQKVTDGNQLITYVPVSDAKDMTNLNLVTANDLKAALPIDVNSWNIETKKVINPSVKAPINKGDVLGSIEYSRNGVVLGTVNLLAADSVEKSASAQIISTAKSTSPLKWMIIVLLVLLALFAPVKFMLRRISKNLRESRLEGRR